MSNWSDQYCFNSWIFMKLLGESLVFQYMAESLLLKDYISIFQDNIVFFTKTMMILMMSCLSQPSLIQSLFLGWTTTNVFQKKELLLIHNLFLSLYIIRKKDPDSLERKIHYWKANMGPTNYMRIFLFKDDAYYLQRTNLIWGY